MSFSLDLKAERVSQLGDVLKIDALNEWCSQKLLRIKWHHQSTMCGMMSWDGQQGNHIFQLLS